MQYLTPCSHEGKEKNKVTGKDMQGDLNLADTQITISNELQHSSIHSYMLSKTKSTEMNFLKNLDKSELYWNKILWEDDDNSAWYDRRM